MNRVLKEILNSRIVIDKYGNSYELISSIDENEGEFLWKLIKENGITQSVEVGCAYGISSLFICDALSYHKSAHHIVIDPYQTSQWHGVGVFNLEKAGFNFFHLIEKPSEIALPYFLERGQEFDFAFIDGWHTFDHTLLDFFYINRLLKVGGILVLDDTTFSGVRKALRYIINYPNYEIIGSIQQQNHQWKRNLLTSMKKGLHIFSRLMPYRLVSEIFDSSVVSPPPKLVRNATMVALRKIGHDKREWNWFIPF